MKTIEEIFANSRNIWDLEYHIDFLIVDRHLSGYSEGDVTETIVVEYLPENRYFKLFYICNSWEDYSDEILNINRIKEVFPKEKTITVYE